jgi:hypothetical protein
MFVQRAQQFLRLCRPRVIGHLRILSPTLNVRPFTVQIANR